MTGRKIYTCPHLSVSSVLQQSSWERDPHRKILEFSFKTQHSRLCWICSIVHHISCPPFFLMNVFQNGMKKPQWCRLLSANITQCITRASQHCSVSEKDRLKCLFWSVDWCGHWKQDSGEVLSDASHQENWTLELLPRNKLHEQTLCWQWIVSIHPLPCAPEKGATLWQYCFVKLPFIRKMMLKCFLEIFFFNAISSCEEMKTSQTVCSPKALKLSFYPCESCLIFNSHTHTHTLDPHVQYPACYPVSSLTQLGGRHSSLCSLLIRRNNILAPSPRLTFSIKRGGRLY